MENIRYDDYYYRLQRRKRLVSLESIRKNPESEEKKEERGILKTPTAPRSLPRFRHKCTRMIYSCTHIATSGTRCKSQDGGNNGRLRSS